jgi:hypothetical protein
MRTQLLGAAVLPPVKAGVSARAPQPSQSRAAERRPAATSGRDGGALGHGQMSSLSGTPAGATQDRKLVHPGRSAEGFGDQADRISGS